MRGRGWKKATLKLKKYLSAIKEQYKKNLEKQVDEKIVCEIARKMHDWDTKYDLLELDCDEVNVIKEENSSVKLQR